MSLAQTKGRIGVGIRAAAMAMAHSLGRVPACCARMIRPVAFMEKSDMQKTFQKTFRFVGSVSLALGMSLLATGAQAQLLDSVKGALGSSSGTTASESSAAGSGLSGLGGLGTLGGSGLGGLALPSLASSGTDNLTGVLQFCIKNNYLSGNGVQNVKDKLLGSLGGEKKAESSQGYLDGLQGKVLGSDGSLDLSGGGFKEELTRKACDQVLEHAQSLI